MLGVSFCGIPRRNGKQSIHRGWVQQQHGEKGSVREESFGESNMCVWTKQHEKEIARSGEEEMGQRLCRSCFGPSDHEGRVDTTERSGSVLPACRG